MDPLTSTVFSVRQFTLDPAEELAAKGSSLFSVDYYG